MLKLVASLGIRLFNICIIGIALSTSRRSVNRIGQSMDDIILSFQYAYEYNSLE